MKPLNVKSKLQTISSLLLLTFTLMSCDKKSDFLQITKPETKTYAQIPEAPESQNSITGRVTDQLLKSPVADVSVHALDPRSQVILAWARTDLKGMYRIADLPAGSYSIKVSKKGYLPFQTQSPQGLSQGQTFILDVALSEVPNTIQGRVTDESTRVSVAAATVQVYSVASDSLIRTVVSDSRGTFTIPNLPGGTYRLVVQKTGFHEYKTNSPGIVLGGNLYTVDVMLTPKPIVITGQVKDYDTKNPLKTVKVRLFSRNGSVVAETETDQNGAYSFGNLPPVYYNLDFTLETYSNEISNSPGQTVGGNTYTVDMLLRIKQNTVYGKVVDASTARILQGVRVKLINTANDTVFASTDTDNGGNYVIKYVPNGTYKMHFSRQGYADYSTAQPGAIIGGNNYQVDAALSPTLSPGQFRIVLTWTKQKQGAVRDVDSYLLIPNMKTPIYYDYKTAGGANLDVDDTDWSGPETVTILQSTSGVYHYYVANYDTAKDQSALGQSQIIVSVYGQTGLVKQYTLSGGSGIVYEFFTIQDGKITDVKKYSTTLPHCTNEIRSCRL